MSVPIHPLLGPNKLKLGVFSMNADGGLTLTRVPERWPAVWSEIVEVAQMGDRPRGSDHAHRRVCDRACTDGASRVCRQGAGDARSRVEWARRTEHRVRMESGRIRHVRAGADRGS